jgi:hypothetical protein
MNKHPADIILEYIRVKNHPVGDSIIAKETGITKSVVEYWITEMERLKPLWIEVDTGYGENKLIAGINAWHSYEIGHFLNLGGFSILLGNQEALKDEEKKKRDLEIKNLYTEIESIKIKPWMIWANIALSVIAIFLSILALQK